MRGVSWVVLLCDGIPSPTSFKHLRQTLDYLYDDSELDLWLWGEYDSMLSISSRERKAADWPMSILSSLLTGPAFLSGQQTCPVQNTQYLRLSCRWPRSQDSVWLER